MGRTPSQELFDEAFGSPEDREAHGGARETDPSLEPVDPRDAELAFWRFGGILFYPMLVRLGKGWMIAFELLVLAGLVAFGALGLPLGALAMLVLLFAISVYQLVRLDDWTAAHNARVAVRRAEEARRRQG